LGQHRVCLFEHIMHDILLSNNKLRTSRCQDI
jgi:hypothetical protein